MNSLFTRLTVIGDILFMTVRINGAGYLSKCINGQYFNMCCCMRQNIDCGIHCPLCNIKYYDGNNEGDRWLEINCGNHSEIFSIEASEVQL